MQEEYALNLKLQAEKAQMMQERQEFDQHIQTEREAFARMCDEQAKKLQAEFSRIPQAQNDLTLIPKTAETVPTPVNIPKPSTVEPFPVGRPKFHTTEHGYSPWQVDTYIDNLHAKEQRTAHVNAQLFHLWLSEINNLSRTEGWIPIKQPAEGAISWEQIGWLLSQSYDNVTPNAAPSELRPRAQTIDSAEPAESMVTSSPKKKQSRVRSIVSGMIFYSLLAVVVFAVYVFGMGDPAGVPQNIGGFAAMTVLTRSMQDVLPQNSLIITRSVDPNTLRVGDDITFLRPNNTTVTHRIVDVVPNFRNTGAPGFQTQGTMNPRPDADMVYAVNLVGLVIFHSLMLGNAILFIRANLILIGIMLAIGIAIIFILRKLVFAPLPEPRTVVTPSMPSPTGQ